jgi:hypothetical protein
MNQVIGIVIFFVVYKKLEGLFKDQTSTIAVLVAAIVLRNLGLVSLIDNAQFGGILNGLLNGAIFMAIIKLISGKYPEKGEISKKYVEDSENETDHETFNHYTDIDIPPAPAISPYHADTKGSIHESRDPAMRATAIAAAKKYMQTRNYRVFEADDSNFDLIAVDSQNNELSLTVIAFEHKNNESIIKLTNSNFHAALQMGRNHRLFIVTDCQSDEDAIYLGNYVTIYYLDSPIDEVGFMQTGDYHTISLRKIKKYCYDQEISLKD